MCQAFAQVANVVTDDKMVTKSNHKNNLHSYQTFQVLNNCTYLQNTSSRSALDPKLVRRKRVPNKLRRKSPLESTLKKSKAF